MRENKRITAGILAGGKSSRMGKNKAFLEWKESTFLEETIELFRDFDEILVSVGDQKPYQHLPVILVEDVRKSYGPLEGLYRLLLASSHEWLFLAATDMPLLNEDFIRLLLQEPREDCQAVIPRSEGRLHPLCGLYKKEMIPVLEEMFWEENHKMHGLLEKIPVRIVDLQEREIQKEVLENVNTPQEYEQVRRKKK